jgi:chemotaxis protein histidine kinase CheA
MVNAFIEYVKVWRKDNPNVSYKDALKKASVDYKKIKSNKPNLVDMKNSPNLVDTTQKSKKVKTDEEKNIKNGRAKLIREYKKLKTSVSNGNMKEYEQFKKVANALRGKSEKNSYAKALKEIERKVKTKKYQSLVKKIQTESVDVGKSKNLKKKLDMSELNKAKSDTRIKKEERQENRKRDLKLIMGADGKRKYTDKQIDQMLKLESEGLSSKDLKNTSSALGKYLYEDYVKEFMRINPTYTKFRAEDYIKTRQTFKNDPYTIPIITNADDIRISSAPPKAPAPPPALSTPTIIINDGVKLTTSQKNIRDKLFEEFGGKNLDWNIQGGYDKEIAKDLFYGDYNDGDNERITTQKQISERRRRIKRVIKAYGTNRGVNYNRLEELDNILEEYSLNLKDTKKDIKDLDKKQKEQTQQLFDLVDDSSEKLAKSFESKVAEDKKKVDTATLERGKKLAESLKLKQQNKVAEDEIKALKEKAKKAKLDADQKKKDLKEQKKNTKQKKKKTKLQDEIQKAHADYETAKKAIEDDVNEKEKEIAERKKNIPKTPKPTKKIVRTSTPPPPPPKKKKIIKTSEIDKLVKKLDADNSGELVRNYTRMFGTELENRALDQHEEKKFANDNSYVKTKKRTKRDKQVILDEVKEVEDFLSQLENNEINPIRKQVQENMVEYLLSGGDANSVDAKYQDLFSNFGGRPIIDSVADGKIQKLISLGGDKSTIKSRINDIINTDMDNSNVRDEISDIALGREKPASKNEYDGLRKRLVELNTEVSGSGFGAIKSHLKSAKKIFDDNEISSKIGIAKLHLKSAKTIMDLLGVRGDVYNAVNMLDKISGGEIEMLGNKDSYDSGVGGTIGGSFSKEVRRHLHAVEKNKENYGKREEHLKQLRKLLNENKDLDVSKKLKSELKDL